MLSRLSARHDRNGYAVDAGSEALQKLSRAIVAFEIEIDELLTKLKLGQNRSAADRGRGRPPARGQRRPGARGIAAWMARVRPGP